MGEQGTASATKLYAYTLAFLILGNYGVFVKSEDVGMSFGLFRPFRYQYNRGRSAPIQIQSSSRSFDTLDVSGGSRSSEIEYQDPRSNLERSLINFKERLISTDSRSRKKSAREIDEDSYLKNRECCVFIFLDGSAHFFDTFLRQKTGTYTLQPGTINEHPHYANKACSLQGRYTSECTYIWKSKGAWIIGDGTSIGETRGVMFGTGAGTCPVGVQTWKYLDSDLSWRDNGKISLDCMDYDDA